eukprot:COSAG02_NODE_2945_length_7687_cov_25.192541_9_plen_567_part_00
MAPLIVLVVLVYIAASPASIIATADAAPVEPPALLVEVRNVRLNAQRPEWSNVCPPPVDAPPTLTTLMPVALPPCRNPTESQGLPGTDLRLTWELSLRGTGPRGLVQKSYEAQIMSEGTGKVVWSGNASTPDSTALALPTPELSGEASFAARVRVAWVSVATGSPTWSSWSAPARFDTRPSTSSWAARDSEWIGGHNQLRSAFSLPDGAAAPTVKRARLYAIGLGAFVLSLNGQRIGDHILDPPQSAYPRRVLFSSYNVTERLRRGSNVVGVLLGRYKYGYMDVWCNLTAAGHAENACRSFRMQLVVELSDGAVVTHVSSSRSEVADWYGRQGPVVYDHEYHGERYDSRIVLAGWDNLPHSSFPRGTWEPVAAVPAVRVQDEVLSPVQMAPIRMVESRKAISIRKLDHAPGSTAVQCNASSGRIGGQIGEGQFDDSTLKLACAPGSGTITKILFANFGTGHMASGCSRGIRGTCAGADDSLAVVEKLCLGKTSCEIAPRVGQFGGDDPCPHIKKTLVVLASGCTAQPAPPPAKLRANETSYVFDFGKRTRHLALRDQGGAGAVGGF